MKYKQMLSLIISLLIISTLSAQEQPFGKISIEEINMTHYKKDSLAGAVVLFDLGKVEFVDGGNKGYVIKFTRHKRIKFFNKSKALEAANIYIPYQNNGSRKKELVKNIIANTYNLDKNGALVTTKLTPDHVYDEKINQWWDQKKFTFPNLQNGTVVEFRYELESPFLFNLPSWKFQDKIPTMYSAYQVHMIPFYEYVLFVKGISKFRIFQHS